ncbi:MAG: YidC/Oxa1 family membrane protein insertase [Firmicutes bacterium]|nr:YidC/Oxa1 family membrane protein insertase [Bacillota bacterium]
MLSWLADVMRHGMTYFFNFTGSYGAAIILLTLVVRVVLLPLSIAQVRQMARTQALNPEIEALRRKYKNDPERLNRETVELWKKHKANPMSGCLLILIQFPIWIALLQVLQHYPYAQEASFLWLKDLAKPDNLFILPILAAVTTYWQTKISTPATTDKSQNFMFIGMPILIGWMSLQFPSGLALYWVTSNLFGIVQQYLTPVAPLKKEEAKS